MGLTASLREPDLRVVPGQEVTCQVSLLNTGTVVDQVTVDVVGQAAGWSTVEPPVLNLYPGQGATAVVRFHPPRSPEARAGLVPFGVRAVSQEDPAGSIVEEGAVEVEAFTDLATIIRPTTSRGRRKGNHRLTVINRSNVPVGAAIHFVDPEDQLTFRVNRSTVLTDPGVADELRVQAIPRKRFLRGPDQPRPFQVMVAPDDGDPVITEAEMIQRPLLARWVVPAAAAVLALLLLGTVLWLTLLKPTIKSAATNAVNAQMSPLSAAVDKANQQAQQAQQAASQAASAAAGGNSGGNAAGAGGAGASPGAGAAANPPLDQPVDFRIQTDAAPRTDNGFNTFTATGQNAKPLDITDIQLQNPLGDQGIVEIRRNNKVWLRFGLDNFRDYDDHFVVPVHFNKGETVTFAVSCKNPGGKHCTPALTFSGRTTA
jgi:hypothetical protein